MPRYDSVSTACAERAQLLEPPLQTAVQGWNAIDEQEVRREQCLRACIERAQIIVRMGERMCGELEDAISLIELRSLLHDHRGLHDPSNLVCAEDVRKPRTVVLAACGECPRQVRVPHEGGLIARECVRAEDMVGMHVRHDYVADGSRRRAPNMSTEPLAVREAPAGVHDRDGVAAHDETDIRDGIEIVRRSMLVDAATHVNTRC